MIGDVIEGAIEDIVIMSRQFATMIRAGLPLMEVLNILAEQSDKIKMQDVLKAVERDVETGSSLKEAIEKGNQTDPEGPFQLFPNYKTMGQNEEYEFVELTPMQVNLLADLSCWNVTNSEEEFKTLLDG